jgi:Phospholipase_D-nuclease N-terminal
MKFLLYGAGALVIFTVFVSVFAASADKREVRLIPKWVWVLLCIFVTPFGGLLYLTLGRPAGAGKGPQTRTLAPDDDPEFLRKLAERLRNEGDEKPNE